MIVSIWLFFRYFCWWYSPSYYFHYLSCVFWSAVPARTVATEAGFLWACADRSSLALIWVLTHPVKPCGDIPPWSCINHFPWHVSVSSLWKLLSVDLISSEDLTGQDTWRPTDPYSMWATLVPLILLLWLLFLKVAEIWRKQISGINYSLTWVILVSTGSEFSALFCYFSIHSFYPLSKFLREPAAPASVGLTRQLL